MLSEQLFGEIALQSRDRSAGFKKSRSIALPERYWLAIADLKLSPTHLIDGLLVAFLRSRGKDMSVPHPKETVAVNDSGRLTHEQYLDALAEQGGLPATRHSGTDS